MQAVLNNPEKVTYMKERIPLGRLGEPEDVVGEHTARHARRQRVAAAARLKWCRIAASYMQCFRRDSCLLQHRVLGSMLMVRFCAC